MEEVEDRLTFYSRHLYNILDYIGASEYVRKTLQHGNTIQELLLSATQNITNESQIPMHTYKFGSAIEGTTTPGLQSDLDCLICTELPPVVESVSDIDFPICLLMISDENTPPGYTKLQKIVDKESRKLWEIDDEDEVTDLHGRPVLKNTVLIKSMTNDEINGPAGTTSKHGLPNVPDLDYIPSYRCRCWPSQANAWLTRTRQSGFPDQEMCDRFVQFGSFLVSTGHSQSTERDLQWRISFSVQEREIMFQLNQVQFKCYVILKMIKNNFIKPRVSGKSLTSYHCKTSIFYLLEETSADLWYPDRLVYHVTKCLETLIKWFKVGFVPNYFIPESNMLKCDSKTSQKVVIVLSSLLETTPEYLKEIKTDSVGLFLSFAVGEPVSDADVVSTPTAKPLPAGDTCQLSNLRNTCIETTSDSCSSYSTDESQYEEDEDSDIVDIIVESLLANGLDASAIDIGSPELERAVKSALLSQQTSVQPEYDETDERFALAMLEKEEEDFIRNFGTVKKMAKQDNSTEFYQTHGSHTKDENEVDPGNFTTYSSLLNGDNKQTDTMKLLAQIPSLKEEIKSSQHELDRFLYKTHFWTLDYIIQCAKELLVFVADDDLDKCIGLHKIVSRRLMLDSDKRLILEHTGIDRRMAAEYIRPFLETSLGSQLVIRYLHSESDADRDMILNHLMSGQESDVMSGKLKLATALFKMGSVEEAKAILDSLDERLISGVTTECGCSRNKNFVNEQLRNKIRNEQLSTMEILREHVGVCVWFLPTEIDLIPKDLQYEMFRSIFSQVFIK